MSGEGVRVPFSWGGSAFHTYLSVIEGPMHQLLTVKNLPPLFLVKVTLSRYTGFVLEVWEERLISSLTRLYDVLCQKINDNVEEINMTQRHLRLKLCPLLPSDITYYQVRSEDLCWNTNVTSCRVLMLLYFK